MVEERKHDEELSRMRKAFEIFDVDGDGTITAKVSKICNITSFKSILKV